MDKEDVCTVCMYIDAHSHDRIIAIERNEIEPLGLMCMNLMSVIWSELNKKEKNIIYYHVYIWDL